MSTSDHPQPTPKSVTLPPGEGLPGLLQRLLDLHLDAKAQGGPVTITGISLLDDGLLLHLRVSGSGALSILKGQVNLRLNILHTSPDTTRLGYALQGGAPGKLMQFALRKLPPGWINQLLHPLVGDALRLEGEHLLLSHAALLNKLLP